MRLVEVVRNRFADAMKSLVPNPDVYAQRVQAVRDPQFGDYQANIAMGLSKELKADAVEVAQKIVSNLKIDDLCHPPEIAARGFINLRLRNEWISEQLHAALVDSRCGVDIVTSPKTFIIDYSSPNVAKPMHVGHIRSTVIGDAISRILRFLGHKVISDNHLGDWGTQFGMVIYGYKNFVDANKFAAAPVAELSRLYRRVNQIIGYQEAVAGLPKAENAVKLATTKLAEVETQFGAAAEKGDKKAKKELVDGRKQLESATSKLKSIQAAIEAAQSDAQLLADSAAHPGLDVKVLQETAKLHAGDTENRQLWDKFLPYCLEEIHSIYRRLGISFDLELGESFYQPRLGPLVDRLLEKGMATVSEGAVCVFLPGFDAPMIIRKQDGAFLYATTDLATIEYRAEEYHPNSLLYVVDHRQGEHFAKLFIAAKQIGYDQIELKHVSFGTVLGPDGKPYKTRSGTVVGLESLLDEAVERAFQVVSELSIPEEEKRRVADVVGLGAIKYADLVHNRTSDYVFDLDKMIRLEGHTATYIQYSYARTRSILRNANVETSPKWLSEIRFVLESPVERDLALTLLKFEETLHHSLEEYYPSVLAEYCFDLSKLYASFFEQCPVLKAESESLKHSRLGLCYLTGRVLRQSLELLGIDVVERM